MKAKCTWILVADGGRARILENLGSGKGVHQVAGVNETLTLPPNRVLQHDRPGRGFESAGPTRHAYEASDPHREMKRTFAAHLVDQLSEMHANGRFDRLVLVAPSPTMGDLRAMLTPALSVAIIGELTRDLTHTPTDEIAAHIEGIIAV